MASPQIHPGQVKQVAVFASGAGSNAAKIIEHFRSSSIGRVCLVVCNNPGAGVLTVAEKENVPVLIIERKKFNQDGYLPELRDLSIDLLVLAGFLWKIPPVLINAYPGKIVNIHPALLPKYGGKNMYGKAVHEAVLAAGEKESGITIHYVDEMYDHGATILQVKCDVDNTDTAESLADKIHVLEHSCYARAIEELILKN